MKKTQLFLGGVLIFFLFANSRCRKGDAEPQLPPITQIGANTFGCLVNNHVYIPMGYNGTGTPNPHVIFDIGLNGLPYLGIDSKQLNKNNVSEGQVLISFGNIKGIGTYKYPQDFNFSVGWVKYINNCGIIAFDSTIQKWGAGVITKYDLANGVISGTFNFKYKTLTCDTVLVTDGRFDIKL